MKLKVIIPTIFVLILILLGRPTYHLIKVKWIENIDSIITPTGYTNDASRLNLTKVDSIINIEQDGEKFITQLQSILRLAKEKKNANFYSWREIFHGWSYHVS